MRVAQRLAGLLARGGRQPPQGHAARRSATLIAKERTKFVDGCVAQGHTERVRRADVRHHRAVRRLLVQQVALGRLRLRRVPDRVPEGELPASSTSPRCSRASRPTRTRPRSSSTSAASSASRCSSPTSTSRSPTSRCAPSTPTASERDPLRAVGGAQRRRGRGRARSSRRANEGGPFTDFYDFCDRVDPSVLNKRTIESLVKAGAFDSLGHPRQGLVFVYETDHRRPCSTVAATRPRASSTSSRRSTSPAPEAVVGHRAEIPDTEFPKSQRLAFEKEMLGLYVSDHPLMGAERALRRYTDCTLAELRRRVRARCARSAASSPRCSRKYTKRGDLMATFVLEDLARRGRGDGVPEDDGAVRPPARGRRHRRGEGPPRRARRHAEDHRDGGHPARARARRRPAGAGEGASSTRSPTPRSAGSRTSSPSTPATARCSSTSRRPRRPPSLRLGDDLLVDAGNGLFAELRILLGADCIT